jgi:beta-1,4-mannosyltransferase
MDWPRPQPRGLPGPLSRRHVLVAARQRHLVTAAGANGRRWVVITDYPRWPSPYFAQLHRHAPSELGLLFRPDLDSLKAIESTMGPGVINLHRLKRLYRDASGARTLDAARSMLDRLASLRARRWRLAWTVHNLLPIDGAASTTADRAAAEGVLALADTLLCHTAADATALADRTRAEITVTGWAGLGPPDQRVCAEVARVVSVMRSLPISILLLGRLTAYKDVPATVAAFLTHTRIAHLTIAGTCSDPRTATELTQLAATAPGRVLLHVRRVAPDQAAHLYAAAHAAVCPYRSDGEFAFFSQVLHPSSVGTAVCFRVPVIAPRLPAIIEMTHDHPRWLAEPGEIGSAFGAAEADLAAQDSREERGAPDADHRWQQITRRYCLVARNLSS